MKSKRNCVICNSVFYAENSEINRGHGLTCSKECKYKNHSKLLTGHKMKPESKRKLIKSLTGRKRSKSHSENISKGLMGKYAGKLNGNWKGGKYKSQSRWYIRDINHPHKHQNEYILNSRYIAEQFLNRYLTPKEQVHHINFKKDDDRIENLYLFSSCSEHSKYHNLIRTNSIKVITESNLSNY